MEEAKECIKAAVRQCPSMGNGNDIIHTLPVLHMVKRDWFNDDDDFVQDVEKEEAVTTKNGKSSTGTSPVVMDSIRNSVSELKHAQLQQALKSRGLKWHGNKEQLRKKLFNSLIEDAGLDG